MVPVQKRHRCSAASLLRSSIGVRHGAARKTRPADPCPDTLRRFVLSARPQRATKPLLPERRCEACAIPDLLAGDEHRRDHAVRAIDELLVL